MKEDQLKEWLQHSIQSPSDSFSEELMDRIEAPQKEGSFSNKPILAVVFGLILFSGAMPIVLKEEVFSIPLIIAQIDLPVLPLQICLLLSLLLVLYQGLFLRPIPKQHMGM
ncbi:MAG: hypothetical protein AAF587_17910 [Bacteroidota bacterium]